MFCGVEFLFQVRTGYAVRDASVVNICVVYWECDICEGDRFPGSLACGAWLFVPVPCLYV